jgi:hypothetical protein
MGRSHPRTAPPYRRGVAPARCADGGYAVMPAISRHDSAQRRQISAQAAM